MHIQMISTQYLIRAAQMRKPLKLCSCAIKTQMVDMRYSPLKTDSNLGGHADHEDDLFPIPPDGCPSKEKVTQVCHATGTAVIPFMILPKLDSMSTSVKSRSLRRSQPSSHGRLPKAKPSSQYMCGFFNFSFFP